MFALPVAPTAPPVVAAPPALVRTIGPASGSTTAPLDGAAGLAAVVGALPVAALRGDGTFETLVAGTTRSSPMRLLSVDAWSTPVSTSIRAATVSGTRGFTDVSSFAPGQAGGIDGYDWHVIKRKHSASAPAATRLIALDDAGHIHLMSSLPSTAAGAQVVPAGRGVRVVTTKAPSTVMTDSGRVIASIHGFAATSSIGLADGSLLLAGTRRTSDSGNAAGSGKAAPATMRKVSRTGAVSVWRPGFTVAAQQSLTPLQATPHGIVYLAAAPAPVAASRIGSVATTTPEPVLILRTTSRHTIRRTAAELGVARSPACAAPGTSDRLAELLGPAGTPIAKLDCVSGVPGAQVIQQSTLIGLSDKLEPRWIRDITPAPSLGAATVGPQGTLISLSALGATGVAGATGAPAATSASVDLAALYSATVPGAPSIPRGSVLSVHVGESGPPFARLRCDHAEGRICNGIAELSAGGKVIARARYAMRARPGQAAGVVIRHFPGAPRRPHGRLSVRLRPVT